MVNKTILGGLKIAMSHKSSLKDAMQSFYNSGYDKDEVEEAAKIIFNEQNISKEKALKQPAQISSSEVKKKISKKSWKLIILLIGILIVLFGVLTGLFIFKDKIF